MEKSLNCSPILLIIFNRPELTKRVFNSIRLAKPKRLFIAADGPRLDKESDNKLCAAARGVVKNVDWDCEVHTLYRDQNLGCKIGPSSAITWFFENVEEGIILEDDCVPTMDFFRFCDELLVKYRNDTRIGMISGNNFGFDLYDKELSYSFSKHGLIWGWATWKRCWEKFNINMNFMNTTNIYLIKYNISNNLDFVDSWWKGVNAVLHDNFDAWSYQWGVTRYANNFLIIRPRVNLVANIGFGEYAMHTKDKSRAIYNITGRLVFPLVHPEIVIQDYIADNLLEAFILQPRKKLGIGSRAKKWIKDKKSGSRH